MPAGCNRCVWNLLSNAIKSHPGQRPRQCFLGTKRLGRSTNGLGHGPGYRSGLCTVYVLIVFGRQTPAPTRHFGGLGLGLSIVRHLVELHGGTVEAHSEGEERGATFYDYSAKFGSPILRTRCSLREKSSRRIQPPEKDVPPASIAGQQILLVDDDENTIEDC